MSTRLVAPGKARVSFVAGEAGEYRVDIAGHRTRIAVATAPERGVLPVDPGWANRLAALTGGRVLSLDEPAGGLLAGRRDRIRDLVPGLLALAALIFFADTARQARRVAPERRADLAVPEKG